MGTTAEKLTYLNETKTLIKDNLNLGGANISNEPFRVYSSKLIDIYKDFLANGTDTLWDNWNKVSGTGESLTLNNTIKAKMKIEYGGNTSQEGTPTPDYPQDIHVVSGDNEIDITGKNLLNIQSIVKGRLDNGVVGYASDVSDLTLNEDSFSFTTAAYWRGVTTDFIKVKENTDYFFSSLFQFSANDNIFISACYDENKNWLGNATTLASGNYKRKFTTVANTKYVRLNIQVKNVSTTTINNPQLEEAKATEYQKHYGASYPVNLGDIELCKIGDYQDSIVKDNGKWYLNKQIGRVVLDGSETWSGYTTLDNDETSWFQATPLNDALNVLAISNSYLYSDYFSIYNCYSKGYKIPGMCYHTDKKIQVRFPNNLLSDTSSLAARIASFKDWLSNNNTTVYYVLATPTYEEITDSTLISQLEAIKYSCDNQTNISQTNTDKPFILDVVALGKLEI